MLLFWNIFASLLVVKCSNNGNKSLVFTEEPQNDIVILGTTSYSIACSAISSVKDSKLIIVWKHNNTAITDFTNKHFKVKGNTLNFVQFLQRDVGFYQCIAIRMGKDEIKKEEQISSRVAHVQAAFIGTTFKSVSNNVRLRIGETSYLQCVTPDSLPTPTISWYKNERKLSGHKNGTVAFGLGLSASLKLSNFSLADVGKYQCKAHNKLLDLQRESSMIDVSVKVQKNAPYFHEAPSPVTVTRYSTARFDCVVLGDPTPNVQWFRNDVLLTNNSMKYRISTNGSLLVLNTQLEDDGDFKCVGSNIHASIQSNAVRLTVAYIKYDFALNPQPTTLIEGDSLVLDCLPPISHPSKPLINWFFNYSEIITNSNNSRYRLFANGSLLVTEAKRTDKGVYFCQAVNTFSKIVRTSTTASVTVLVPPVVSTNTSVVAKQNDRVVLRCRTTDGLPYPTVKIVRRLENGTVIEAKDQFTIASVSPADGGLYSCIGENGAGVAVVNITLTVLVPPVISDGLTNRTMVVYAKNSTTTNTTSNKTSITFSCTMHGHPVPVINWSFRGQPLIDYRNTLHYNETLIDQQQESAAGVLVFFNVSKANEGWIQCTGKNVVGEVSSKSFLKVFESPQIEDASETPIIVRGGPHSDNVTLVCVVRGDPRPNVDWMFNNNINESNLPRDNIENIVSFANDNSSFVVESRLTLVRVFFEKHHGMYRCSGRNQFGITARYIQLIVFVEPVIQSFSVESSLKENATLTLACRGFGSPPPEARLVHNGSTILRRETDDKSAFASSIQWNVTRITSQDSGLYECEFKNVIGVVSRNRSFVVKVTPVQPSILNVTAISSRSIYVAWQPPQFTGYTNITSYVVEIAKQTDMDLHNTTRPHHYSVDGNCSFLVSTTALDPFSWYDVRMRSVNEIGSSGFGDVKRVQTFPEAPSVVRDVKITQKSSRSLKITWQSPLSTDGIVSHYQIWFIGRLNRSLIVPTTRAINNAMVVSTTTVNQLTPYTPYAVKIRAGIHFRGDMLWGEFSDDLHFVTYKEVPGFLVSDINVTMVTINTIRINFSISGETVNQMYGVFQGYQLTLVSLANNYSRVVDVKATWFLFSDLTPYTKYSLRVSVRNDIGLGNFSEPVEIRTAESVPDKVENVTATEINTTTIRISWKPPLVANGLIKEYKVVVLMTSDNDEEESKDITTILTNNTHVLSSNFTSNASYIVHVTATTSAGYGQPSGAVEFTTSVHFQGNNPSSVITTLSPPAVGTQSLSWLDREYLVVIIAVSAFTIFLLLLIMVFCVSRICCARKLKKRKSWEVNPYYNKSADQAQAIGNKFTKKKHRPVTSPTAAVALKDYHRNDNLSDLIWDDDTINDLIDSSSVEPEYTTAFTPSPPPLPPPRGDNNGDGGRAVYSCVDPYQGRSMDLSPLVRLNGMNKSKRHPRIPSELFSSTAPKKYHKQQHQQQRQQPSTLFVNNQASPSARSLRSSVRSSSICSSSETENSSDISSVTQITHNNNESGYYTRMDDKQNRKRRTADMRKTKEMNYTDVEINSLPHGNLQMRGYSNTQY